VEGWPMETKIATLFMFAMTAGMAAIALLVVMHHDFGLARGTIRINALLSASLTSAALALAIALFKFQRRND
jgi:hypothetical protein